ncbi:hypothetical protein [Arcicella rosea]|uniref:Uncharacterized protein n=1 Tax=Arcicella rosea TaxID=502909 RepID=A0A841EH70_9BACT|nr:hypothetical protein [Arcicella rosea]MBB6002336.1 hypothetical protein [Arcicella rosea]
MKQKISDKKLILEYLNGLNEVLTSIFDMTATLKIEAKECTALEFIDSLEVISETLNNIPIINPTLDLDWFNNASLLASLKHCTNETQRLLCECKRSASICSTEWIIVIENHLETALGHLIDLIIEV